MAKVFEGRKSVITLLKAEDGATGRQVEEQAKEVVEAAREKAREILNKYTGDVEDVLDSINYRMQRGPDGPYAVIGIRDRGGLERYLAKKETKEQWLSKVLNEVL